MKTQEKTNFEYPRAEFSILSEEQQINEILSLSKDLGKIWHVVNVAKAISDKTKCTDLSAFQWAFELCVTTNDKNS